MTEDLQLVYTNCPEKDYFRSLFSISGCSREIRKHFAESSNPLIASDKIGFVWIAAVTPSEEAATARVINMLGPVFTSDMSENYLYQNLNRMSLTQETISRITRFFREVPRISRPMAASYAGMLHYALHGEAVKADDIETWVEATDEIEDVVWGQNTYHGSWDDEQRLFRAISEGRIVDISKNTGGRIGNIGGGDPLRQAKNEIIVFSIICSRASIIGGVSPEGALNLCDFYIQKIEYASNVADVYKIGSDMYQTYVSRVRKMKEASGFSAMVRGCMEYISTHVFDKISLESIADDLGYSRTYISRKFKKETGTSLAEYIAREKIQVAKDILKGGNITISQLSDQLNYSSPSYFSALFKKVTGMSPQEYQNRNADDSMNEKTR
ncbi:MAG: AraC family transcriptional regulator [Solobacterium sp.]|nr:AraC family transcriptional regulator [Solobacterium sp.]